MALPISHRIGPAEAGELEEVRALLRAHALPTEGLDECLRTLLVSRSRGRVIGCAALEIHGNQALLRSVAVDPGWQGRGLGKELTERAMWLARSEKIAHVYLLTTTAADYFERYGFERCTREDVPAELQNSLEFTTLCPASATVMRRDG